MSKHLGASFSDLTEFDLTKVDTSEPVDRVPVTFWLPKEYKEKYDLIQMKSKRKFGKHLQKVLISSIEKVEVDSEAS